MTALGLSADDRRPRDDRAAAIGALAVDCLRLELDTHPKPGLVSLVDSGSHRDMDAALMSRAIDALAPWFVELAAAGAAGARMDRLRAIGVDAEAAMMVATGGVNSHRGAIFGLGLLAAAAGFREAYRLEASLGRVVADVWGADILAGPIPLASHGALAARRYRVGGARVQAATGFPAVYDVALPALSVAEGEPGRVQACMALIAGLEDTNLLHRAGPEGLAYARTRAAEFLASGGVTTVGWRARATAIHRAFVARNLSPGGSADLLAMGLFVRGLAR